jgi:cytochrome P450
MTAFGSEARSAASVRAETSPSNADTHPLPPGPREPAFLQALQYVANPYRAIESSVRRFGDRYTGRLPGLPATVTFNDPDAIKDIFLCDEDQAHAGEASGSLLAPILGANSLLVLDGARHLRERRMMLPPFHGERIHVYGRIMRETTERVLAAWPVGRAFPIHAEMQAITLEVIMRAVFGVEDASKLAHLRSALLRLLSLADGAGAPFIFIPMFRFDLGRLSPWGRLLRDRREVARSLLAEIEQRRADGTAARTDILSMLIDARDEHGGAMGNDELLDEMLTLLLAGHETTATSLAWVFHHVLSHFDVLEKLRDELRAVIGDGQLEAEHVGRLEYLDLVIKESARLTPVATNVLRILKRPSRIGGLDLPAGVAVSAGIYATHHRPDLWPEPERFLPERFRGSRPSGYAFFPFGGGLRRCIGAAFATYEMKVVLATVFARAALRIAPGYRMRPVLRAVTIGPSRGMPVLSER